MVRKRLLLVLLVCIFYYCLILVYRLVIVRYWGYHGFAYTNRLPYENFILLLLTILPALVLPPNITRPSIIVVWGLYLSVYIPTLLVSCYTLGEEPIENLLPFYIVMFISLYLLSQTKKLPLFPIKSFPLKRKSFIFVIICLMAVLYIPLFFAFGKPHFTNLSSIYETRLLAREILGETKLGYFVTALAYSINPFAISYGLISGRLELVILSSIGEIVLFGWEGMQTFLFIPLILWVFYFVAFKMKRLDPMTLIILFIALIVSMFGIDSLIFGAKYILTSLATRRLLFVPGLLSSAYFDFFSSHPYMMWKYSKIGGLIENVLGIPIYNPYWSFSGPGFVIGKLYFGSPTMNANANLWADGFANLGLVGMLVETIIALLYLWLFDVISLTKDHRLPYLMVLFPYYSISQTGVLTTLLTHGALLTLVLFIIFPSKNIKKE